MTHVAPTLAGASFEPIQLVVIGGTLLAMSGVALSAFAFLVYHAWRDRGDWLLLILKREFASLVVIPMSAGAAAAIVLMFQVTLGTIKFSILGVSFEGASGPVVLWAFCFLAFVAATKLLWAGETTNTRQAEDVKKPTTESRVDPKQEGAERRSALGGV